jgi:hypothetical protein
MKLEVYCCNCKEYILETDTEILDTPLKGFMFKVRPDREWWLDFDDNNEGLNLTCPVCGWMFHVEQSLMVRKKYEFFPANERTLGNGAAVHGKPKKLKKLFATPEPPVKPEPVGIAARPVEEPKPKPKKKRGFFQDTTGWDNDS